MATELDRRDVRMFDYANGFAQPFRDAIRAHTVRLAAEEGVEIEYIQRMTQASMNAVRAKKICCWSISVLSVLR